ncbi:hypothetical protein Anas_03569, partial [Armadillidium nasatum]
VIFDRSAVCYKMSKSDEFNVIQSLKIQVDNDRIKKIGDCSDGESMEDEYEEGEASSDGDEEVEVNVIVGSGGNKPDSEVMELDSKNAHTKNSKSTQRDREPSFYRPPAVREKLYHNNESENLKSFFKSSYSSKSIAENEELPYDFIDDSNSKQKILEERAKRFGFQKPMLSLEQIQQLYKSLEISNDDFIRGGFRADSIHCRGFENCKSNVTWLRKEDAMRALVGLSCPIKPSKQPQNPKPKNKNISNFNSTAASENSPVINRTVSTSQMDVDPVNDSNALDEMDGSVSADYVGVVIPPGRWRLGVPCPNTKAILMRYAHCKDKKLPGLEKPIELYQDYLSKREKRDSPRKERRERTFVKARKHHKKPDDNRPHPPYYGPQDRLRYDFTPRPAYGDKFYKDLDDPVEVSGHPWGFLAQNWGKKETQENIDYQELLRQHVTGQKRKRDPSDNESDEERDREDFYRSPRKSSSHHRSRKSKHRREDFNQYDDRYEEEVEDDEELLGQNINDDEDVVAWNSKIKLPIMRMYADAEEKKNERRKKNLAKGIGNRLSQGRGTMWRENRRPPPNSALDLRAKLMRKKLMA